MQPIQEVPVLLDKHVHVSAIPHLLKEVAGCDISVWQWDALMRRAIPLDLQEDRHRQVVALDEQAAPDEAAVVPAEQLSREQLEQQVAQLTARTSELEASQSRLRKSRNYFRSKCVVLRSSLAESKQAYTDLQSIVSLRNHETGNTNKFRGFCMALCRNEGHVGAACALRMLSNHDAGGQMVLKDKNIILRFEHLAAAAKRMRSCIFFEELAREDAGAAAPAAAASCDGVEAAVPAAAASCEPIAALLYQGDATTADILDCKNMSRRLARLLFLCCWTMLIVTMMFLHSMLTSRGPDSVENSHRSIVRLQWLLFCVIVF